MSDGVLFRVVKAEARLRDCMTRLPFRFGVVTMRGAPLCVLRVEIETATGERVAGYASDLLVPKWFEKVSDQNIQTDWQRLLTGIGHACDRVIASKKLMTAFQHWDALDTDLVINHQGERTTRLLLSQSVSIVERAMLDALCRMTRQPLHTVLRDGFTGFDGARLGLKTSLSSAVRSQPIETMQVRHTVGLVDAVEQEQRSGDAPDDGLPTTLEGAIQTYGLSHFKLKVSGQITQDLERLSRIASTLSSMCDGEVLCTLDGNEQFDSMTQLDELLAKLSDSEQGAWLFDRIAYIEQPLARGRTLHADAARGLDSLSRPVIIDEADMDRDMFTQAVGIGYRGVSVKNCKGVFRAIASAMRCHDSDGCLFQSAEDLTNIPIFALHQDLVTSSMLGLSHIERNGHHYFAGLTHLHEDDRDALLREHSDLYQAAPSPLGGQLSINAGHISIGSLHQAAGYGYAGIPNLSEWVPRATWSPDALLAAIADAGDHA